MRRTAWTLFKAAVSLAREFRTALAACAALAGAAPPEGPRDPVAAASSIIGRSPGGTYAAMIGDTSECELPGRVAARQGLDRGSPISARVPVVSPQPVLPTTPDTGGAPRGRALLSPMSRQPSFASPDSPLARCGPGSGEAIRIDDSENQNPNRQTVAGGTFDQCSAGRLSSMSSGTKRRLEDVREDAKAVMEARLRKEYDQMYAKRLRDEVGMRKAAETRADAAEKAAEVAIDKFNARFREVRMWRIRTYRAKSALNSAKENHFVRENDDTWLRTTPVQTEVGGKRLAIKHQLVRESICKVGGFITGNNGPIITCYRPRKNR